MKITKEHLTQEELKRHVKYDPETGVFTRIKKAGRVAAGSICSRRHPAGYFRISIDGFDYLAHRLAWLYMTGEWPKDIIDHKDGVRDNNRWTNLRDSTPILNSQNRVSTHCIAGKMGVQEVKGGYTARICVNRKQLYIGFYKTAEKAHMAYVAAKQIHHPHAHIAQ